MYTLDFKDKIYKFLKNKNITEKEFCKLCKINLNSFFKVVSDKCDVSANLLFKIAKGMQVDISFFITDDNTFISTLIY